MKSLLWFWLFAFAGHGLDFEAVDSSAWDGGGIEVGVLAGMIVVHEAGEGGVFLFLGDQVQAAFADDTFIGVRAVAFVWEVLQAVFGVHLERGAVVAGHELELSALEGTVEVKDDFAIALFHAEIQRQNVGETIFVIECQTADLCLFHDLQELGSIGDFAVMSSHVALFLSFAIGGNLLMYWLAAVLVSGGPSIRNQQIRIFLIQQQFTTF